MLTGLFGQGIGQALGSYNHLGGLGASAQQAQSACQQGYQQQAMAQQMAHAHGSHIYQPIEWMFNGKTMSFTEFVEAVFPNDTAEKTAFVLKWSNNETS